MKKLVLISSVLLSVSGLAASNYYPTKYQQEFQHGSLTDDALKAAIHKVLISGHQPHKGAPDTLVYECAEANDNCYSHHSLGYKGARRYLFGELDLQGDSNGYYVTDVYCNKEFDNHDFKPNRGVGPMTIPDANVLNCEHTWPQSRFTTKYSKSKQKSDLHHLFSTSSKANGVRGNNPFGEVVKGKAPMPGCSDSQIGRAANSSRISYQPPRQHRGNVARALFYFSVRYEIKIDRSQEEYLRKWHQEDPVTDEDIARNQRIMELQGNRNPFIDYPDLVDSIRDF